MAPRHFSQLLCLSCNWSVLPVASCTEDTPRETYADEFHAAEAMALIRRHLVEKVAISTICNEATLQPFGVKFRELIA